MSREGYLEKAQRTGKLIIPSKLGEIPEEAYTIPLTELSLAGNMLKTLDARLAQVRSSAQPGTLRASTPRRQNSRRVRFAADRPHRAEHQPERLG